MGQIKQVKCVYDTVSEPHMKKKKKTQIKLIITNGAACSQSDGYKFNTLKIKIISKFFFFSIIIRWTNLRVWYGKKIIDYNRSSR